MSLLKKLEFLFCTDRPTGVTEPLGEVSQLVYSTEGAAYRVQKATGVTEPLGEVSQPVYSTEGAAYRVQKATGVTEPLGEVSQPVCSTEGAAYRVILNRINPGHVLLLHRLPLRQVHNTAFLLQAYRFLPVTFLPHSGTASESASVPDFLSAGSYPRISLILT